MIELTDGMRNYRVVDYQAVVHGETQQAIIRIAGKRFERRVIDATGYIALIQETESVKPGRDGWHTEGPIELARPGFILVQPYAGDRKCSCASYWNTGNPHNLVERHVVPIDAGRSMARNVDWSLWRFLARRHERVELRDRPPSGWFRADLDQLLADVQRWLSQGHQLVAEAIWTAPASADAKYLYLVTDESGQYVKFGKCAGSATSPPLRRLCQYQPGNPRRLDVGRCWLSQDPGGSERRLQQVLRRWCTERLRQLRAEWFEISLGEALNALHEHIHHHASAVSA